MKQSSCKPSYKKAYESSKAIVCIGLSFVTAFAPAISQALDVKVQRTVNLRTEDSTGLRKVGRLAAGSVVSIPDEFAVKKNGSVDFESTLNNWLSKSSNLTNEPGLKTFDGVKKDFYFPIKVVKAAPGSETGSKDSFMVALHYLQRKGALLETTQDTDLMDVVGMEVASPEVSSPEVASGEVAGTIASTAPSPAPIYSTPIQSRGEFEASAGCVDCSNRSQPLHSLASRLQASLDSYLAKPLSKMAGRTVNDTGATESRFRQTCRMSLDSFIPQLRTEIARSTLKSSALTSTMMMSLATQETTGNCNASGDHGTSVGLFQVNARSSGYSRSQLRDPIINARAALNNLESKERALSREFDFSKMTEQDRMRLLVSAYNGGEKWVTRAKDDLLQFNRRQGASLNPNSWEHLRIFYFRRHLDRGNEYQAFGTVRGRDQRSTKNSLSNLAYTENLIPRHQTAYGITLQEAWHRRISG